MLLIQLTHNLVNVVHDEHKLCKTNFNNTFTLLKENRGPGDLVFICILIFSGDVLYMAPQASSFHTYHVKIKTTYLPTC